MQQYSNVIKQHYKNPLNAGKLSHYTHFAEQLNPLCGDEIKLYLKIAKLSPSGRSPEGGKIADIKYEAHGCMIAVAAASVLSEFIKGKTLAEIKKITKDDIDKLLGAKISKARELCSTLTLNAIKKF